MSRIHRNRVLAGVVVLVLACGYAHVTVRAHHTSDVFFAAVEQHNAKLVHQLLQNGADPNIHSDPPLLGCDAGSYPLLLSAIHQGDTQIVRMLLEAGADVNAEATPSKTTALMDAAEQGRSELVRLLLDSGATIDVKDYNGATSLIYAVANTILTLYAYLLTGMQT